MGAGIGGLAAAALLARQGAKVLVVESHDRPGGSCTSWQRKARLRDGTAGRFIFDSGVQDFSGLGPGGALRWLLTELGLGSRLTWHRVRHRYHLDDLVVDVPATAEGFARKLQGMFPGEAGGLADFFKTISTIYKDLGDHGGAAPGMPQTAAGREQWVARHPVSAQWMQSSFAGMLDAFMADERPKHFLTILAEYLTDDAASLTAGEMAPLFGYYIDGGFYPQGGSQELANALAEAVKENGGQLRLSTRVDRINTDNGRATSITLQDGEIHHSGHVIYNGDVGLLPNCLDAGLLPPRFRQRLNSRRLGPSAILVNLALDRIPAMPARVFVTQKDFTFGIGNPSAIDPTLAPPSCAAVTLLCLLNEEDSAQWFKFDRSHLCRGKGSLQQASAHDCRRDRSGVRREHRLSADGHPTDLCAVSEHQGRQYLWRRQTPMEASQSAGSSRPVSRRRRHTPRSGHRGRGPFRHRSRQRHPCRTMKRAVSRLSPLRGGMKGIPIAR